MGYKSVILVVQDVIKSSTLYQSVFCMKVIEDHGIYNVGFDGGLSLYQRELFENISKVKLIESKSNSIAVYFEYNNIDYIQEKAKATGLDFIHFIEEQPWGQLVFRVYDYDNHLIEVAENMDNCLQRLSKNNMSIQDIAIKTGYSEDYVKGKISTINN